MRCTSVRFAWTDNDRYFTPQGLLDLLRDREVPFDRGDVVEIEIRVHPKGTPIPRRLASWLRREGFAAAPVREEPRRCQHGVEFPGCVKCRPAAVREEPARPWGPGMVHDRLNDTSAGMNSISGCVNVDTPLGPRCANPDHWRPAPVREEPPDPQERREVYTKDKSAHSLAVREEPAPATTEERDE